MLLLLLFCCVLVGKQLIIQNFSTLLIRSLLMLPLLMPPAALLWWQFADSDLLSGPAFSVLRDHAVLAFPLTQMLYLTLLALAPVIEHRLRRQAVSASPSASAGIGTQRNPTRSKIFSASA